ncbi:DUF4424 domain-containing protein [Aurantimonas sp. VKM B-3413]|uniref:DUF4424 domain-containing protein n=1 Tax=Aurantimonas sp. VKM B-3413 TaxID=2779401 RepID=UPI001E3FE47F|nr:DUF4424 domain-containing protein [Aurantimonas sp. VKM B-3413]MCB8840058.1 DUF4424 domain-containing protein [Aurantimonas sp. VKM B-3413]
MIRPLLALALATGLASAARANDSTANLAAGGLVFTKTDAIEMRSEDLSISLERIAVDYVFVNTSDEPVTTTVAFPLPEIRLDPFDFNVDIPSEEPDNPFAFETMVDGQPIGMTVDRAAFANGENVTAELEKLGLAFAPPTEETSRILDALPKSEWERIEKAGIAATNSFDAGRGWETHLSPSWAFRITYHWQQTFPPGRKVRISHSYKPSVGSFVSTLIGSSYASSEDLAAQRKRYCIDDDIVRTVKRRTRAVGESGIAYQERWIDYVLTTGANWAKPIGSFKLTVDKGDPKNLVSFCADGVRKVSPTKFEVTKTDFTPTSDLSILILTPSQP